MSSPKKIVVLCHEASLTGAPILLLNLLKLLKKEKGHSFLIVIGKDGPVSDSFRQLDRTIVLKKATHGKEANPLLRIKAIIGSRLRLLRATREAINHDLILSNTLITGDFFSWFKLLHKPVMVYVHELRSITRYYESRKHIQPLIDPDYLYLYPSTAVKNYLLNEWKLPEHRMHLLNYFIPDTKAGSDQDRNTIHPIRSDNGKIRIYGMGVASPRKGTDLFIEAATLAVKENPRYEFRWVGGFASPELEKQYRQSVQESNLSEIFSFTGLLSNEEAQKELSGADLLFLSSREDPYPLVVLEAAKFSIPSLVFKDGGGITDFVNEENGWIAAEMTALSAAAVLGKIEGAAIGQKGIQARRSYEQKHADGKLICDQFQSVLQKI